MPWPALSKAYCSYVNVATTDNTSTATIYKNHWWQLKAALRNQLGSPTSGTRHANSVWTCVGSSDGVTAALDGVDRWGATFDVTKVINAADTTPHSWIVLANSTLGVQLLLDLNSATGPYLGRVALTTTAVPWALNATPTRSPPSTSVGFAYGVTVDAVNSSGYFVSPALSTLTTHYASFTSDDSGEFYLMLHRPGLYGAYGGVTCLRTIGGQHGLSNGVYLWGAPTNSFNPNSGISWPSTYIGANNGGYTRNIFADADTDNAQGVTTATFGGNRINYQTFTRLGADYLSAKGYYRTVHAFNIVNGLAYRGYFPDLYETTAPGNGASYPSVVAQTHIQLNNHVIPLLGAVPLMG